MVFVMGKTITIVFLRTLKIPSFDEDEIAETGSSAERGTDNG